MGKTEPYQACFDNPARLDEAMNRMLRTFIDRRVPGYHEGMSIQNYVLHDRGQPLAQAQSAGLLSPLRAEVNRVVLDRLRKAAGLNEQGWSD